MPSVLTSFSVGALGMAGTNFDSHSKNIGELLGANTRERIVVPTFQRGYSWGKKHVEAFWVDILQFQNESDRPNGPEKYFLGPIVILRKSREVIELLDGQQRLATATILFSVLRDIAKDTGIRDGLDFSRDVQTQLILKEEGKYSLEMGETDEIYFKETIQSEILTTRKPKLRTHRNIQQAREFLMEKVKTLIGASSPTSTLAVLKRLRQTLRSDLVMACIPVDSERDAFRIFETLNDRGLRLSVPDLLLNYLMREAKPETDRKQIRDLWTEMIERMGRRDINRFLRHMWVSKYGDLKSIDLFTALKQHIEDESIGSLDFTRGCADECESYVQLLTVDETHLGNSTRYVRSLLQELDFQVVLPLLLSTYLKLPKADFEKVIRWVLVFVTRYSIIGSLDSTGLETVFFNLARDTRSKIEAGEAVSSCMAYIKDTLAKNAPSDERIKASLADLILQPDEARYLLKRLAQRMQTDTKEVTVDEANLEHIFPKNPSENEWGGKANHDLLEPYLWHIGNLTMLGERLNREAANKEFSVKREHYVKKSELQMAQQIARSFTEWNETTIRTRAAKLTTLVLEIWNFDNPSRV